MKKLTRVKLINWHRFVNETIDLEKSTLISGENGAGKSTLLDAIQFVIICSTNYFNKAAHENRSTIRGLYVFSRKSAKVYQSVSDNE